MLNQFTGIGRWTKDNTLKYTTAGMAVNKNTIALDRFAKKGEEKQADFLPVTMFGKLAEVVAEHSGKGRLVCVIGRVQTRSWDQDGEKRYATEIIAETVKFLDYAKDKGDTFQQAQEIFGEPESDLPF